MSISFNQVPANLRVPFLYAEFDNENAVQGPSTQPYRTLMIGPRLASGTKAALSKNLITSYEQAKEYFGDGSLLAEMAGGYLQNNKVNELWCVPMDDAVAGVASTGSIQLTGTPTKSGALKLYIAGRKVEVAVASGDALADIVTNIKAVMDADDSLLVSSVINGGDPTILDFTAKSKMVEGDDIDIRFNYFDGDEFPAGLGATITDMNGGAANPDVADVIGVLDDTQYILVVSAYKDASNINTMETELTTRFGPITQNDGFAQYGTKGSLSELITEGDNYNSQFTTLHRASGPIHPAVQVSAKIGVVALQGQIDPARPFQTLEVLGILAESDAEKLTLEERNILLFHGIATDKVIDGGKVVIERVITTYKKNNAGADDVSYLDLNTLLTLSYIRYDWRNYMLRKYPRHKLANDGTRFASGQKIMTPNLGKAEAITKFEEWEENGLVEGLEQFKEDLIVERNDSDVNRLDFLLAPDLVNQLRVMGTKIGFLL